MIPVCFAFDMVQLLILKCRLICCSRIADLSVSARLQCKVWHQGRETRGVILKPNYLQNADLKEGFPKQNTAFGCVIHCLCR